MVKYIITDFDGTLVDTYAANVTAYSNAFFNLGFPFSHDKYHQYFGMRFDDMMTALGVIKKEDQELIRQIKKEEYRNCYDMTVLNHKLLDFILTLPCKLAIASTASKENLYGVLKYHDINNIFDVIVTGEDVKNGKPHPEVYLETMKKLGCNNPDEVLVFEDSSVGIAAAENAGIKNVVKVVL